MVSRDPVKMSKHLYTHGRQVGERAVVMDLFTELFLEEVQMFAIYSTILGLVMFFGTYISIMMFNYAAHSQIFRIRGRFLRSVLNQDIAWYDVNQSGEFASRMNE